MGRIKSWRLDPASWRVPVIPRFQSSFSFGFPDFLILIKKNAIPKKGQHLSLNILMEDFEKDLVAARIASKGHAATIGARFRGHARDG